jgi:hypothetical protein
MKRLAILTALAVVLGSLGLMAYAQKGPSRKDSSAQSSASSMPMGPGMMGRNMMGNGAMGNMGNGTMGNMGAMMSHYWSMMHSYDGQESPASMLAFQGQLQLTGRQVEELRKIEQQASTRAKKVLSQAQLKQYESYMQSSSMHAMMNGQGWTMPGMQGGGMMSTQGMGSSMMHGSKN